MTNGNTLLEFEEKNIQQLTEDYMKLKETEFKKFVEEEYNNWGVD